MYKSALFTALGAVTLVILLVVATMQALELRFFELLPFINYMQ